MKQKKTKKKIIKSGFIGRFKKVRIVMISITHKILVLLKNPLNYLKDKIFEILFKECTRRLFFSKENNFFSNI